MFKKVSLLLSTIAIGAMAIFNPGQEEYRNYIAGYISEQKVGDEGLCEKTDHHIKIWGVVSLPIKPACQLIRDPVVDWMHSTSKIKEEAMSAERMNLGVGSMYRFNYDGQRYGTVGVLGKFYVVTEVPE